MEEDKIEYRFAPGDLVRDQTNNQTGMVIEIEDSTSHAGVASLTETEYIITIVWQHRGDTEQLPDWYAEEILSIL